ncbi:MAG: hypothetical protein HFE59_06900 [Clostridiales bacterium]|nr:hypothetical protein [Clostridiales bacterium]
MKLRNLIIFMIVLFIFTGCGMNSGSDNLMGDIDSNNVIEKYNNAVDYVFNADSYTISANTDINMTEEGKENVNMGMSMTSELKTKNDEKGNRAAELNTLFKLADMTEEGGGYYKDEYFYPKAIKQKIKTDYENIFSEGNINIFKITEKVLSQGIKPVVEKAEEGYRVEFELDVNMLKQEIPELLSNISDYLRISEYDFTMNSCKISAVIGDDGILKSEKFLSKAQVNLYDGTSEKDFRNFKVNCNIEIIENISDVNNTEVVFPDGLSEYADITPKAPSEKTLE